MFGVRVGWQLTPCDLIWQVTLRSFVMSFLLGAINRLYPMSLNDIPNRSVDPFHNMRKSNYEVH